MAVVMNRDFKHSPKAGFTLVEVSLAILVVGLGLLTLFGLFPSGLRAGEEAAADTQAGLFASVVFEGMRANAAEVKTWAGWRDASMTDGTVLCDSLDGVGTLIADNAIHTITDFPTGSGKRVRYLLRLGRPTERGISAYMRVWERTGDNYSEFYTEFLFGGR